MSDDSDNEGGGGPREDDVQLDDKGFPVTLGIATKVAARDNPLKLHMEMKKRKEDVRMCGLVYTRCCR